MKINKNSTLAFVSGMLIASSVSMFAARDGANIGMGHKAMPCMGDTASSTQMMRGRDPRNNMTDTDRAAMQDKMNIVMAQALGMSKEALIAAKNSSTTINQLIKNAGLTESQFRDKMHSLMGSSTPMGMGRAMMWR